MCRHRALTCHNVHGGALRALGQHGVPRAVPDGGEALGQRLGAALAQAPQELVASHRLRNQAEVPGGTGTQGHGQGSIGLPRARRGPADYLRDLGLLGTQRAASLERGSGTMAGARLCRRLGGRSVASSRTTLCRKVLSSCSRRSRSRSSIPAPQLRPGGAGGRVGREQHGITLTRHQPPAPEPALGPQGDPATSTGAQPHTAQPGSAQRCPARHTWPRHGEGHPGPCSAWHVAPTIPRLLGPSGTAALGAAQAGPRHRQEGSPVGVPAPRSCWQGLP